MSNAQFFKPGLRLGNYPQKQESRLNDLEQNFSRLFNTLQHKLDSKIHSQNTFNNYVTIYDNKV